MHLFDGTPAYLLSTKEMYAPPSVGEPVLLCSVSTPCKARDRIKRVELRISLPTSSRHFPFADNRIDLIPTLSYPGTVHSLVEPCWKLCMVDFQTELKQRLLSLQRRVSAEVDICYVPVTPIAPSRQKERNGYS
jgi:hypothetical protein